MGQDELADVVLRMLSVTEGMHFRALARVFNNLARTVGSPEPQVVRDRLLDAVERAKARGDRVIRQDHVRSVLDVTFDKVFPALEEKFSGVGGDPRPFLANPFLYARIANTVLRYSRDFDRPYVVARAVTKDLADFLGYRPTPVLEGNDRVQPRPAERTLVVPVYLRGVGLAYFKFEREVELFLECLRRTPEALLESCGIVLDAITEIAVDPRVYDYLHPAWHRPGHVFGEYDPERVSVSGYYERFVIRAWLLEAARAYRRHYLDGNAGVQEELVDYQAGVGLAATALLAVAVSGAQPGARSAEQTLAKTAANAALAREDFYRFHIENAPATIAADLRREREDRKVPFAAFRLHLNRTMVRDRAAQVAVERAVRCALAYRRPEFVADLLRSQTSRTARRDGMIREAILLGHIALDAGDMDHARTEVRNAFSRIVEGVEQGECGDPWYMLGFSGNYPLADSPADAIADPRLPRLIEAVDALVELCARLATEAFLEGQQSLVTDASRFAGEVTEWWSQFGAHVLHPAVVIRGAPPPCCSRYDLAIDALSLIVMQSGPLLERVRRAHHSLLPETLYLLGNALLRRGRLDEAEEILLRWLGGIRPIGCGAPRFIMGELLHYWLYRVMFEDADQLKKDPVSVWRRLARFADRLVEVCGPLIDLPEVVTPVGLIEFYDRVNAWIAPEYNVPPEPIKISVYDEEDDDEVDEEFMDDEEDYEEEDEYEEEEYGEQEEYIEEYQEQYDEYDEGEFEEGYVEDDEGEQPEGADEDEEEEGTEEDEFDMAAVPGADELWGDGGGTEMEIPPIEIDDSAVFFEETVSAVYTHIGFLRGLSSILTAATYVPDLGPEYRAEQRGAFLRWAELANRVHERVFRGICAGLSLTEEEFGQKQRGLDPSELRRYLQVMNELFKPLRELSRDWAWTLERLLARLDGEDRHRFEPTYLWWAGQLAPIRHAVLTGEGRGDWAKQLAVVATLTQAAPAQTERVCPRELAVPGYTILLEYFVQSLEDLLFGLVLNGQFSQAHRLMQVIVGCQTTSLPLVEGEPPIASRLALRWAEALGYQTGKLLRDYNTEGDPLPDQDERRYRLVQDVIRLVIQFFHTNRLEPPQTVSHVLRNDAIWKAIRRFVLEYGGDLLTKEFMNASQLLTVMAKGTRTYLDDLSQAPLSERPHLADVFANSSPSEQYRIARALDVIVRTIIENYELYAEYNIATSYSDYGNLAYILLDFIRVKVPIERLRDKLRPLLSFYIGMLRTSPQDPRYWCELPNVVTRRCEQLRREVEATEQRYQTKLGSIRDALSVGVIGARERQCVRWLPLLEKAGAPLARKLDGSALWYQCLKGLMRTSIQNGDPSCAWMEEATHWLERYEREPFLTACRLCMEAPVQKEAEPSREEIEAYVSAWNRPQGSVEQWYEEEGDEVSL